MRLIDADALIERLDDFNKWCKDERLQGSLFAVDVVGDMPTVCDIDAIKAEIAQSWDGYLIVDKDKDYASNTFKGQPAITTNHVFEIIDKYRG